MWSISFLAQSLMPSMLVKPTGNFATHICKHLSLDKNLHIFKHLMSSENCHRLILDDLASTHHQLKIKEAVHILWEQPLLNVRVKC